MSLGFSNLLPKYLQHSGYVQAIVCMALSRCYNFMPGGASSQMSAHSSWWSLSITWCTRCQLSGDHSQGYLHDYTGTAATRKAGWSWLGAEGVAPDDLRASKGLVGSLSKNSASHTALLAWSLSAAHFLLRHLFYSMQCGDFLFSKIATAEVDKWEALKEEAFTAFPQTTYLNKHSHLSLLSRSVALFK